MDGCAALVVPGSTTLPPIIADSMQADTGDDLVDWLSVACQPHVPFNLTGNPGLVLPGGFAEGTSVSIQLVGRPYDEATLLQLGVACRPPPITTSLSRPCSLPDLRRHSRRKKMTAYSTIYDAGAALRSGAVSSVALTQTAYAAADAYDDVLGTYLARYDETALAAAAQADAELAAGLDRGLCTESPWESRTSSPPKRAPRRRRA